MSRIAVVFRALILVALASTPSASADAPRARPDPAPPSAEALSHYLSGRLLEEEGDFRGALAEYFRALALDPGSATVARRASELASRTGEHGRALELADRALSLDPADARSHWLRGAALFSLERPAEAIQALERAVALDSLDADYWRTLARVAEVGDDVPRVQRAWRMAAWLDPDDGEAWFQLAAADARLGRFGAADSALAEAIELNPDRPGTRFLRGWVDEGLGRPEQAIEAYREHLAIHATDRVTRERLVRLLASRQQWDEAWREAHVITTERPDDPEAIEVEADLALRSGRKQEAEALLDRLHRDGRASIEGVERAVGVLARNGRGAEAATIAVAWGRAHPDDARGPMMAARAWATAGDSTRAIDEAKRAVALAPDSLAPYVLLGRLLDDTSRHGEAEAAWAAAFERFPQQLGVALALAQSRERRGDVEGAERAARAAVERHPDAAPALNTLGYLLADRNRSLAEASRLIARAVEQEPDNGAYVDSQGWVEYRLGRLPEARRLLERAVELTNGDATVLEHLADVYKDLKLLDLARQHYEKSLQAGGDERRVRAKIESLR